MNRQELYEFLDIETPQDFMYVENVSQYLESDDDMEPEDLKEIFAQLDGKEVSKLFEEYFEEIMEFVPDGETETYELLSNVLRSLTGLMKSGYTDGIGPDAVDEMERLGEGSYRYDFTDAYDYPLDDYVVNLRDLTEIEDYEEDLEQ